MPFEDLPVSTPFSISKFCIPLDYHWTEDFFFAGETHHEWEVVHVIEGEVECTEADHVYHLKAGDMILHAPDEFHNIRSFNRTRPHLTVFSFLAHGSLPENLTRGVISLNFTEQKEYRELFVRLTDIYERRNRDEYNIFMTALDLTCFFLRISETHTAKPGYSPARPAKEYHNVVSTMRKKLYETCTLQDFSDMCNISTSYMKDLFYRYAGVSPKIYYSRMRCDEAVRLLRQGVCVHEVADRMGFSSPNYFCVFFKNIMGASPARYVKQRNE